MTRVVNFLRPAAAAVAWMAITIVAVLLIAFALGAVIGQRSFTVMSGSMEPEIATGDIVVSKRISPGDARVGEVVTFRDPAGSKRLISHRVRRVRNEGTSIRFTTRGDANNTFERWSVPAGGKIGRVWLRIPKLGYVLAQTRTPVARIGLVVIPALLIALIELLRIWRPQAARELPARRRKPGPAHVPGT